MNFFDVSCFVGLAKVANGDKLVIWIPVGNSHRDLADILFCSLKKHKVTNYIYFAHDLDNYEYLTDQNRNVFYNGMWYVSREYELPNKEMTVLMMKFHLGTRRSTDSKAIMILITTL